MTKWAAADVPVRVPRAVVTVPVEGASIGPVVHVSTRDDQPLVSLHPTILFIFCSHFRRHPSSMIFPLYFSFAGRFYGGGIPHVPLEMVISDQEGGRRRPSSRTQSRCDSPGRRGQQRTRCSREHQRRPAHRLRPDSSSQGSMCLMSQLHRCRFQFPATPGHSQTL